MQHVYSDLQQFSRKTIANNGKITTFTAVPLFDAPLYDVLVCRFPWT